MRISTQLVLFFIFFNAGAGMLVGSGVAADLGIDAQTNAPDELDQASTAAENAQPGQAGATLFGLYARLANITQTIFNSLFPGMAMLKRTPIPGFFIDFVSSGLSIIAFVNIASFLRGTEL